MVVVDGNIYTSASSFNHTTAHHRRYPSIPTIKEVPNRGAFNPTYHEQNAFEPPIEKIDNHEEEPLFSPEGRAPTIVSTVISPTVTRQHSKIRKKKRFMISSKELRNQFFYPVKAPKRKRSKRGKFRNSVELDASMNYVNIDSSMSKDLCLNQQVKAYEIECPELIKMEPKLKETTKAITIDSNNNYIIYTPSPTMGKNSVISDAEQLLDQELLKLGTPITFNKNATPVLPEYKIDRPYFNRYDTYPIAERQNLIRTRSLPTNPSKSVNRNGVQGLWNLYLRRVIAARISWRLEHMRAESQPRKPSMSSSVETGFFMNALLKNNAMLPPRKSCEDTVEEDNTSAEEVEEPVTDDDHESKIVDEASSRYSRDTNGSGGSTGEVLGSLDSLLNEMRSIIE